MTRSETETPLSDLMASNLRWQSGRRHARAVDLLYRSRVGIVVTGSYNELNETAAATSLAVTSHAGGRRMLLAFADPSAFVETFDEKFNGTIDGQKLFRVALEDPDCHGIQVNSALAEISMVVDREQIKSTLSRQGSSPRISGVPWWKFW